jgi:hypothetical protein
MGQATRTTKLLLEFGARAEGGANTAKRAYLEEATRLLDRARAFYVAFFLAHPDKLAERVRYFSEHHQEERERLISSNELLTWAEFATVATARHPHPRASNHPTLYQGAFSLELDDLDLRKTFVRLKVYDGKAWIWVNYPVKYSRYFEQRRTEPGWERQSPQLILRPQAAELHVSQTKAIQAKKVVESKRDPDLVTVAVDLNVKQLAVITVRQHGKIIQTRFVSDHGLDQHRYRHLRRVSKKQWQSGKPVNAERSNQQLWAHIRRLNRKQANQLKGKINQLAKEKAYASGVVSVEVNPHGTSQYCARCGA